jgi:hypothetical protein
MRRVILLLLVCFALQFSAPKESFGQAQKECSTNEYATQIANSNPEVRQKMMAAESFLRTFREEILSSGFDNSATAGLPVIKIPVVVHILYKDASQNVSDERITQQIDILNKAFRLSTPDTSKIPFYFQEFAADCRIEFVLARIDPSGRATTGIVRKNTWVTLFGLDDRIKNTDQGGDEAWDRDRYLNIWVGALAGGVVGYSSPLGGPKEKDGIAIRTDAFGPGASALYNGGKTLVHEVGHWLGLRHIWGDASCGDDQVDDTPKQRSANRGCPSGIKISCDNAPYGDMYNNYMDQVNDECMLLFTKGQMNRMRASFAVGGPRYALLSSDGYSGIPIEKPADLPHGEPTSVKLLQLYPNPTQNKLIIQFKESDDAIGSDVNISNQFGQVVKRIRIQQLRTTVDVSAFQGGMYFVTVYGVNRKLQDKFLKQ